MEEDIKILEELMKDSKDYGQYCLSRTELNAIENLIKGYRELKERNIYLVNERKKLEELLFMSDENYIPKSKIKEKIEELEKEIKPKQDIHQKLCIEVNKIGTETEYDYAMQELSILDDELREMLIKKRVLQELMEDK